MIQLRDYQVEAIAATAEAYRRGVRRPLIGLPTGTGKTIIFASIVSGAVGKDRRALILAHRDELITQAMDKLVQVSPELETSVGVVKAEQNEYARPVTVASVQSLHPRRLERTIDSITRERLSEDEWPWDVIVVDEAHHAAADSYVRVLDQIGAFDLGGPLVLGVTATPQRADGRDLGEVWEEIVYHRDMLSMMRAGYLCNLKGIAIKLASFDDSKLKVRAGDFVAAEAGEALTDADAPLHTVRAWLVHASERRTLVFTPTIDTARRMAAEYRSQGVNAAWLSGETPLDERRELLRRFASGEIRVLANCQVLTEGFDDPGVECIVIARPTRSQPLYVQMVGRGTRLAPGKPDCLILDVVGVTSRMDLTTLPKMFGMGDEVEEGDPTDDETQTTLALDVMGVAREREEQAVREGRIVASQVELFDRRELAWNLVRPGVWCLSLADEIVVLTVGAENAWQAHVYPKEAGPTQLATGLSLTLAMGVAEDYARRAPSFARKLIDKSAAWRAVPATEDQKQAIEKFGRTMPDGYTKGEASDMLSQLIAASRLARR